MIPDTIFVNVKELIDDGIDLGGKYLDVSRIPASKQLDEITSALSVVISLLSKEASQEIVLDGLVSLFSKHSKSLPELEQKLAEHLQLHLQLLNTINQVLMFQLDYN